MNAGKHLLRVLVGCAISVLFLWLTLRGKDLQALWASTREADYSILIPYVGILLLIHLIRTLRWGILLERLGTVGFWRLNRATAVGAAALVTLPFRLGELARPYLISERGGPPGPGETPIRMSAATATVVIERVFDGLCTSAILLTSLLLTLGQGAESEEVRALRLGGFAIAGAFGSVGIALAMMLWQRERAVRFCTRAVGLLSRNLASRVVVSLESFLGGVADFPRPRRLLLVLLLTFAYWGVNGAGMALLARGFGIHLSLIQAYAVLGVLVIGVMIPAGPGMVGTFQFFVVLGLGLFLPKDQADTSGTAYANVLWATQFAQQLLTGLFFFVLGRRTRRPTKAPPGVVA